MGAGIAQVGLTAGLQAILFDLNAEALARATNDSCGRAKTVAGHLRFVLTKPALGSEFGPIRNRTRHTVYCNNYVI
jgi:hypothetical protein